MAFKEYIRKQLFLPPSSLHDFLLAGYLARVVNKRVNALDLPEVYERDRRLGCFTYHFLTMLKDSFIRLRRRP
jgi:hypothetical protein